MDQEKQNSKNLGENLKQLAEISSWFEQRENAQDIEQGLEKVREAVKIIKSSKERIEEVENEFEEIKKDLEQKEEL